MYDLIIAYVENEDEEKHDTCTIMSNFYGDRAGWQELFLRLLIVLSVG
jgi:hypothetical protein